MRLCDIAAGGDVRVSTISLSEDTKRRLFILGMTDGTSVSVLRRRRRGAMIIKVRGVRYAVGRKIAEGIFVTGGDDGSKN